MAIDWEAVARVYAPALHVEVLEAHDSVVGRVTPTEVAEWADVTGRECQNATTYLRDKGLLPPGAQRSAEDRFWRFVEVDASEDPCWAWIGHRTRLGYGRFRGLTDKTVLAHRFAYEVLIGPIPAGLDLDHLCRNTSCVNPAHLEPVTHKENVDRGIAAQVQRERPRPKKTHCIRGHELAGDNLRESRLQSGRIHRTCAACRRNAEARHRAETSVAA